MSFAVYLHQFLHRNLYSHHGMHEVNHFRISYILLFIAIAICSLSTLTHTLLLARRLYQQGVLHVRFLWVVMACVFDPLLPGVCLHASCHTLFLDPIVYFLLSFIYRFLELLYYFHYYLLLRVF